MSIGRRKQETRMVSFSCRIGEACTCLMVLCYDEKYKSDLRTVLRTYSSYVDEMTCTVCQKDCADGCIDYCEICSGVKEGPVSLTFVRPQFLANNGSRKPFCEIWLRRKVG